MQQKIITMTQLALYDKHESTSDQSANDYFRHDYIYRKNLGTRFAVGFGGFILLALYWARNFFIDGADLFELDFAAHLTDSIIFILAILALYSLIGTVQGTREYYLVQKRLTRYLALVRQLERINERAARVEDRGRTADSEAQTEDETAYTAPKPALGETRRLKPLPEPRPTLARPMLDEKTTGDTSPLVRTPQRSEEA